MARLRKIFGSIINILSENRLAVVLIAVAVYLRLYRLPDLVTFLGDQGRDAMIIRRILLLEHFPAIGAPTSIGQIYLGPFYYYFIAPFLWFSNFNPVGLAYGVAIISITGIAFSYFVIKKFLGKNTALFFLVLVAFSAVLVEYSRFSWNPNLLPLFSFTTLYFFYLFIKTRKKIYSFALGAFFSFSIQLHYLAVFLILPIFFIIIEDLFKKKSKKNNLSDTIPAVISFLIFTSPLFIFDIKHSFVNFKSLLLLFSQKNVVPNQSFLARFLDANCAFFNHIFKFEFNIWIAVFASLLWIVGYFSVKNKRDLFIKIHFLNLVIFIICFSFLNTPRFPHYYGPVYYSFFCVTAYLLTNLNWKKIITPFAIFISLALYIFLNAKGFYHLKEKSNNQIDHAQALAFGIAPYITSTLFQMIPMPQTETDGHIRYFLEMAGHKALPEYSPKIAQELFILCFTKDCLILGNPQWQIASFYKPKIDKIWTVNSITVYKLVHDK